ncbi:helix-turn-helix domain-containing protein [Cloacibacillus evryensis]|uniref:HTH cro/C1-type domain-containing protein n=1 Tax=bioreactor metagenome TaxID=1076179 RepID=A0A645CFD9_9ZZZZ|nr:helix-turn-helix transcriptional regulator [Cloacibacillus evryensis]MCQ4762467.1 helix-turn-helix domain-containing protein [Cloacibacillus evryensis]
MIGKEIRARRKRFGLTQRVLARMINVRPTTLCQYENGTNEVSFAILRTIAEVLKCSVIDLAYEEFGLVKPADAAAKNPNSNDRAETKTLSFVDPLDDEIFVLLKDLDQIAKEKVISFMRDQKMITVYFKAVSGRK